MTYKCRIHKKPYGSSSRMRYYQIKLMTLENLMCVEKYKLAERMSKHDTM